MNNEKRIISIFKSFIEKSLIPQIKKQDGQLNEWNQFSYMLMTENVNLNELQNYV